MNQQAIFENLAEAIIDGDQNAAKENAQKAVNEGLDPLVVVDQGLSKGMEVVGARFEKGDAFLPELLMASNTFNAAMEILKPVLEANKQKMSKLGTFLLATVKGDQHNIGKDIVATVLETKGFEVVDIGIDQSTLNIIEAAQHHKADFITGWILRWSGRNRRGEHRLYYYGVTGAQCQLSTAFPGSF